MHNLLLIIEDDILFYPQFVARLIQQSPMPVVGIIIARAAAKHNRYRHALKTIRYFKIAELLKLLVWHARAMASGNSVAHVAQKRTIPAIIAKGSVNTPEIIAWVKERNPDVIFSASPLIVGTQLLAMAPLAVNMHFSLLPAYKGIMPLFHAMAHEETMAGISLHEMTEKIDEGALVYQRPVALDYNRSLMDNYRNFFGLAVECVIAFLNDVKNGNRTMPTPSGQAPSYFRHPDADAWKQFRTRRVPFI